MIANDGPGRVSKEVIVDYFKVFS